MPLKPYTDEALNLEILAEEAAEVIQIKSKIIRFGLDDFHPKNEVVNRQALEREIGHFFLMVDILVNQGTITHEGIEAGRRHKLRRMPDWYFAGSRAHQTAHTALLQKCADNPAAAAELVKRHTVLDTPCTFRSTCAGTDCHICTVYKPLVGPVPCPNSIPGAICPSCVQCGHCG